jgi:hypothetical protein
VGRDIIAEKTPGVAGDRRRLGDGQQRVGFTHETHVAFDGRLVPVGAVEHRVAVAETVAFWDLQEGGIKRNHRREVVLECCARTFWSLIITWPWRNALVQYSFGWPPNSRVSTSMISRPIHRPLAYVVKLCVYGTTMRTPSGVVAYCASSYGSPRCRRLLGFFLRFSSCLLMAASIPEVEEEQQRRCSNRRVTADDTCRPVEGRKRREGESASRRTRRSMQIPDAATRRRQ